jgi:hypothetical protein
MTLAVDGVSDSRSSIEKIENKIKQYNIRTRKKMLGAVLAICTIAPAMAGCRTDSQPSIEKIENNIKQYNIRMRKKIIFIDYSLPIYNKRLFVYDMKNRKIVKKAYVGHALRSGLSRPLDISSKSGSRKTIDGLFRTGTEYRGKSGKSMNVHGLLKKNKNTFRRRIVFHASRSNTALWSQGCFVIFSKKDLDYIIDNFKNGTLLIVSTE